MLVNADTWQEPIELCAQELRSSLRDSEILTPDSIGYGESIKRWSDAVEKKAVSRKSDDTV